MKQWLSKVTIFEKCLGFSILILARLHMWVSHKKCLTYLIFNFLKQRGNIHISMYSYSCEQLYFLWEALNVLRILFCCPEQHKTFCVFKGFNSLAWLPSKYLYWLVEHKQSTQLGMIYSLVCATGVTWISQISLKGHCQDYTVPAHTNDG